uniref:Uncharacterized protein n=1 Tax=Steinernema glaseri TaxID=37863 RepID=A0A1I7Y4C5_9BILA
MKSEIKTLDKLESFFLIVDSSTIGVWENGFRWRINIIKEEWSPAKRKSNKKATDRPLEGPESLNDHSFNVPYSLEKVRRMLSMSILEITLKSW